MSFNDPFSKPEPRAVLANDVSTVVDTIFLMPNAWLKLEEKDMDSYYAMKALPEEYRSLIKNKVTALFKKIYDPENKLWRSSLINQLRYNDDSDEVYMVTSVMEAVIQRSHLERFK